LGRVHPKLAEGNPYAPVLGRPLIAAVIISGIGANLIKQAIPGDRPWWYYDNEHKAGRQLNVEVYTVEGTYPMKVRRFPSGHTTTSVAMAMVVTILWRRKNVGLWAALTLWVGAVVVALSRIYLASHWPLDIIGGTVLGLGSGFLAVKWCESWAEKRIRPGADVEPSSQELDIDSQYRGALLRAAAH